MSYMQESSSAARPASSRRALVFGSFCYFWLTIGFTLGTIVLIFPVRWLTDAIHRVNASQGVENALVILLVLAYVAASFWLALRMNGFVRGCGSRPQRWGMTGVTTMLALGTAWSWRDPGRMLSGLAGGGNIAAVQTANGATFEFGAYPDSVKLAQLASEHATVISLQDAEIPVERDGIANEQRITKELHMRLVSAPMMPWFSDNSQSLETIKQIAQTAHGHYYVHCGLGRDRVNMAKRVIESTGVKTSTTNDYQRALGFDGRKADFDQGSLISLAPDVWLVPHPLKEEMYSCFFQGRPGKVVLMFDSTQSVQDSLLRESRALLTQYAIPFTEIAVPAPDSSRLAGWAITAARQVHAMTPPVTVMAFHTPWHDGRQKGDEAAVAFANAYAPNHAWKITTGTVKHAAGSDPHAFTGGKETGC
jgi:hypothetical protein